MWSWADDWVSLDDDGMRRSPGSRHGKGRGTGLWIMIPTWFCYSYGSMRNELQLISDRDLEKTPLKVKIHRSCTTLNCAAGSARDVGESGGEVIDWPRSTIRSRIRPIHASNRYCPFPDQDHISHVNFEAPSSFERCTYVDAFVHWVSLQRYVHSVHQRRASIMSRHLVTFPPILKYSLESPCLVVVVPVSIRTRRLRTSCLSRDNNLIHAQNRPRRIRRQLNRPRLRDHQIQNPFLLCI
jgi:hypothetical protein